MARRVLTLLLAALLSVFLIACAEEPPSPPAPSDTEVDEQKTDLIDKAIGVFKKSGEDALSAFLASSVTLEELFGELEGYVTFDGGALPTVQFGDGALILDRREQGGALDAYAVGGNFVARLLGADGKWEVNGGYDLDPDLSATEGLLADALEVLRSIDLSGVEKTDLTYADGYFHVSDSYVAAQLDKVFSELDVAAPVRDYLGRSEPELAFMIKSGKLVGVMASHSGTLSTDTGEQVSLDISVKYTIDAVSGLPYSLELDMSAQSASLYRLDLGVRALTAFNEKAHLTGVSLELSADGNLPLYTVTDELSGDTMLAGADFVLDAKMLLDGAKILSADGVVFDLLIDLDVSDEVSFSYIGADGTAIDGSCTFGEESRNTARDAIAAASMELTVNATNNAIKQGNVNITLQKQRVIKQTVGDIVYDLPEGAINTDEIRAALNAAKGALSDPALQ